MNSQYKEGTLLFRLSVCVANPCSQVRAHVTLTKTRTHPKMGPCFGRTGFDEVESNQAGLIGIWELVNLCKKVALGFWLEPL
jgi:hypothetical protein